MKERTTILVEKDTLELLRCKARRRGHTLSEEIREALDTAVAEEVPGAWLLELAGSVKSAPFPATWVDTEGFSASIAEKIDAEIRA